MCINTYPAAKLLNKMVGFARQFVNMMSQIFSCNLNLMVVSSFGMLKIENNDLVLIIFNQGIKFVNGSSMSSMVRQCRQWFVNSSSMSSMVRQCRQWFVNAVNSFVNSFVNPDTCSLILTALTTLTNH